MCVKKVTSSASEVPNIKVIAVRLLSHSKGIGRCWMAAAHSNTPAEITNNGALVVPSSSLSSEFICLFHDGVLLTFRFLLGGLDSEPFS